MKDFRGYYDYWPQTSLVKPLVLCGIEDRLVRRTAFAVAALNGWPVTLLDDVIRHRVALSAAEVCQQLGGEACSRVCQAILTDVTRQQPYHVIALPAAWLPPLAGESALFNARMTLLAIYTLGAPDIEHQDGLASLAELNRVADNVVSVAPHLSDATLNRRILELLD